MRSQFYSPALNSIMIACLGTLAACGGGKAPDLVVGSPPAEVITAPYRYALTFVDVRTGEPITDSLNLSFLGDAVDGNEVVDQNNLSVKGKTYLVENGLFLVAANFDLSTAKDVFSVIVGNRNAGWNESGQQLSKPTSSTGDQLITIRLTNTKESVVNLLNADTKLGIGMNVTKTSPTSGGSITSDESVRVNTENKNVDTENGQESIGTASVTFPANVRARDSNGSLLNLTDGVTISVVKYGNHESSGLSSFPGGFTPSVEAPDSALNGATPDTGAFVSGGFAQFNVTDNATGQPIKNFDQELILTIDLPKGSQDLDGNILAAGDTYPIWSFDQDTGKWKFETDGEVREKTPSDEKNFEVVFKSNHLSWWNLDFYGATCTGNVRITGRPTGDTRPLVLEIVGTQGQRFLRTGTIFDSELSLARYPQGTRVDITVKDSKNNIVGRGKNLNLCASGQIIPVQLPTIVMASLTVNVTESCRDGASGRRSTPANVYFYTPTTGNWRNAYSANGTVVFNNIEASSRGTLYVYNRFTRNWNVVNNLTVNTPSTVSNNNLALLNCTTGGQPI